MNEKIFYETAKRYLDLYSEMQKKIDASLSKAPEGNLKISRTNGQSYYSVRTLSEGKKKNLYISRNKAKLLTRLAQKKYDKSILPLVVENIRALEEFLKNYNFGCLEEEYLKLEGNGDYLLKPYHERVADIISDWENEEYAPNDYNNEKKIYPTDNGEMVRSKSEVIIANTLRQYNERLLYKYERPLYLNLEGYYNPIYPDFTILNKETGTIKYWEHFGMMDDPDYVYKFVRKTNTYNCADILPGRDLVMTFENKDYPLNIQNIKSVIEELL